MIQNILIDLDDTLMDFQKAEHEALSQTYRDFDIQPTKENMQVYHDNNKIQWFLFENQEVTLKQLSYNRFYFTLKDLGIQKDPKDFAKTYENYLSMNCFYIKGAIPLLKELSKHYHLFLASNGISHIQRGRLKASTITQYFDDIFISDEIGYNKPDIHFFDYCFSHIKDFKKEETVMIGDGLNSDIKGGNIAGITTIYFQHNPSLKLSVQPDYIVNDLSEIPALIENISK